ncbi:uncharacterized protein BT62DRAFT_1001655 [Guyanagaster necrorhizus]|uniref:Uncharacterized protein n=1 Tax=Guyanagaster necrorhizus TaxID=856835 RepID=A0A9P7W058_9AGAR|nr:uncharacterized protein BT62DRAFT_1001655 [Guyanagaster necrorhizus MCA 3950]KAG7450841.1 hypothetical protein BT62DRAFT_1001655 [Guyanagaster necrorhizus MCA 3950]
MSAPSNCFAAPSLQTSECILLVVHLICALFFHKPSLVCTEVLNVGIIPTRDVGHPLKRNISSMADSPASGSSLSSPNAKTLTGTR